MDQVDAQAHLRERLPEAKRQKVVQPSARLQMVRCEYNPANQARPGDAMCCVVESGDESFVLKNVVGGANCCEGRKRQNPAESLIFLEIELLFTIRH